MYQSKCSYSSLVVTVNSTLTQPIQPHCLWHQVNDPLRWKGVTMYQTDWSLSSVVVKVKGGKFGDEGKNLQLPMAKLEEKAGVSGQIWGAFLPIGEETERSGMYVCVWVHYVHHTVKLNF
jgi:hypothetical protein